MSLLNPAYAPTVTFQRPALDADGNRAPTVLGDTPVVISDTSRQVFIPRGIDRRAGDQFTYNGRLYTLAGQPRGDMDQPFTGEDFGWVGFGFKAEWLPEARGVDIIRKGRE
jgi:hypothetical protein